MSRLICKPFDRHTNPHGGFCFGSLLSKVLGVKFEEQCLKCFAAAGYTVDNEKRRPCPD